MTDQASDQTVIRMCLAFILLVALSLAGFLVGENIETDPRRSSDVRETADLTTLVTDAPTTIAPVIGVGVVGNLPSISMEDETNGIDLVPVGECFNLVDPASGFAASAGVVAVATVVSCNGEHHYQMFWQGDLGSEVVEFSIVPDAAYALCNWQFPGFVGVTLEVTQFDFWYFYPDEVEWPGARHVSCMLALKDESSWIGSGEASGW